MPISDIPILSMLRERMQWHQERQRVLAENVANADTPNYHARDLMAPNFESLLPRTASVTMARTDPGHMGAAGGDAQFADDRSLHYEIRPRGTADSHEEEMLKLAGNQKDYYAVTSIYTRSQTLIKTAIGKA
jgi:flagellar basal-body rod protein FlgB